MGIEEIRKKVDELSEKDKGHFKGMNKDSRETLATFISNIVFEETKALKEKEPIESKLPKAAIEAGLHFLPREEVYYVIFKQVRRQMDKSLQVEFGWQFTVMMGKVEEIQIRYDHGVLYRINGEWVLQDMVFKTEAKAVAECARYNMGTQAFVVREAENKKEYEGNKVG